MKIIITGGHVTPALAVIDKLNDSYCGKTAEIVFVGRKYAIDGEKTLSFEYKEVSKRRIKFINLYTGRLTRTFSIRMIVNLLKIPIGFFNALRIIKKENPDRILTFGGYIALPIALGAFLSNIPLYAHEQTIGIGLANKIINCFATKIFVAFAQSAYHLNTKKIVVTGNPVREAIFQIQKKPFSINNARPVIYITGGSLGSHSINLHIKKILPSLLKKYNIIHQVGDTKEFQDFESLSKLKEALKSTSNNCYYLFKHIYDDEIGYIYSISSLIIGRAGANTFFELIALGKPAIFVPLPWSAGSEQQKHAAIFKIAGAGEVFNQNEASDKLLLLIDKIMDNINNYKNNFNKLANLYKRDAAKTIIKEIFTQC